MRLPDAIEYLVERKVSPRTAARISQYAREWELLEWVGQGRQHDYSHELLEAFRFFWDPLFAHGRIGGTPGLRRQGFELVAELPCQERIVVISEREFRVVGLDEWDMSVFRDGAVLVPVHQGCKG